VYSISRRAKTLFIFSFAAAAGISLGLGPDVKMLSSYVYPANWAGD
jgi:hypothetical protein